MFFIPMEHVNFFVVIFLWRGTDKLWYRKGFLKTVRLSHGGPYLNNYKTAILAIRVHTDIAHVYLQTFFYTLEKILQKTMRYMGFQKNSCKILISYLSRKSLHYVKK